MLFSGALFVHWNATGMEILNCWHQPVPCHISAYVGSRGELLKSAQFHHPLGRRFTYTTVKRFRSRCGVDAYFCILTGEHRGLCCESRWPNSGGQLVYHYAPLFAHSFRPIICSIRICDQIEARCRQGGTLLVQFPRRQLIVKMMLVFIDCEEATCHRRCGCCNTTHVVVTSVTNTDSNSKANCWDRKPFRRTWLTNETATRSTIVFVTCFLSLAVTCTRPSETTRTTTAISSAASQVRLT